MSNTNYTPVVGQLVKVLKGPLKDMYGTYLNSDREGGYIIKRELKWFVLNDWCHFLTPNEVLEWMCENGWDEMLPHQHTFYIDDNDTQALIATVFRGKFRLHNNDEDDCFEYLKTIHAAQGQAIQHYSYYLAAIEAEEINKAK